MNSRTWDLDIKSFKNTIQVKRKKLEWKVNEVTKVIGQYDKLAV